MHQALEPEQLQQFKTTIGTPFPEQLRTWLKAFSDPYEAVRREVERIKSLAFVPTSLIVHGLVYDLSSGQVEVVVNGYSD